MTHPPFDHQPYDIDQVLITSEMTTNTTAQISSGDMNRLLAAVFRDETITAIQIKDQDGNLVNTIPIVPPVPMKDGKIPPITISLAQENGPCSGDTLHFLDSKGNEFMIVPTETLFPCLPFRNPTPIQPMTICDNPKP